MALVAAKHLNNLIIDCGIFTKIFAIASVLYCGNFCSAKSVSVFG